jgi:hypothetical protein
MMRDLQHYILFIGSLICHSLAFAQSNYIPPDAYAEDPSSTLNYYQNLGQLLDTDGDDVPEIKFVTTNSSPKTWCADDSRVSFTYVLPDTSGGTDDTLYRIDMEFYGAYALDSDPLMVDTTSDTLNYFPPLDTVGITGIRGGKRIIYPDIYEGIDMQLYSNESGLKIYFVVDAEVDPTQLKLKFTGQDYLMVQQAYLLLGMSGESMAIPEAIAYQIDDNGDPEMMTWPALFYNEGSGVVSFEFDSYDVDRKLILMLSAPVVNKSQANGNLCWSTFQGDVAMDKANASFADPGGDVYFAGQTSSMNFPLATGTAVQSGFRGSSDAYLMKFDNTGQPLWGTFIGGSAVDVGMDIAVQSNGDVYLVGTTTSNNFPVVPTAGSSQQGSESGFVLRLNSSGNLLKWSRYLGGNNSSKALGIAIDANDQTFICGMTSSTSGFPVASRSAAYNQSSFSGTDDAFLLGFDGSNAQFWGTYFGGPQYEVFSDLGIGAGNSVLLVGSTGSPTPASSNGANTPCDVPGSNIYFPDCNPGGGAYTQAFSSGTSNFDEGIIVEFDTDGALAWSTYFGGAGAENAKDFRTKIAFDPSNTRRFYIYGSTGKSSGFPLTAPTGEYSFTYPSSNTSVLGYLSRFNSRALNWSTLIGCNGGFATFIGGLATDEAGNVYISGRTQCSGGQSSASYCQPPGSGSQFTQCPGNGLFFQTAYAGSVDDGFLMGFNKNGRNIWSSYFGGASQLDIFEGLTYEPVSQKLFAGGFARSTSGYPLRDPGPPAYFSGSNSGNGDAAMACFDLSTLISSTSVDKLKPEILLFPNPAQNKITMELNGTVEKGRIHANVYDLLGHQLIDAYFHGNSLDLNVAMLPAGVYVVKVTTKTQVHSLKFIKSE